MRYGRHLILLILLAEATNARLAAQSTSLLVEREGATLHVSASRLPLLEGKPLEQLHNGASITYVFELTLTPELESEPAVRLKERFVFSFDLWEEKFSVVQPDPPGRSASQLSAAAAIAWCLDNMQVSAKSLTPDKTFVIRLECWVAADNSDGGSQNKSSLTLAGLVDVFSRKGRNPPPRWLAVAGPLRLSDLKVKKKPKT